MPRHNLSLARHIFSDMLVASNIKSREIQGTDEVPLLCLAKPHRRKTLDVSRTRNAESQLHQELLQEHHTSHQEKGATYVTPLDGQSCNVGVTGILHFKSIIEPLQKCGVGGTGRVQPKKQVWFSRVEVREYPIILGGKCQDFTKLRGTFYIFACVADPL
jgi:hypothetical protein